MKLAGFIAAYMFLVFFFTGRYYCFRYFPRLLLNNGVVVCISPDHISRDFHSASLDGENWWISDWDRCNLKDSSSFSFIAFFKTSFIPFTYDLTAIPSIRQQKWSLIDTNSTASILMLSETRITVGWTGRSAMINPLNYILHDYPQHAPFSFGRFASCKRLLTFGRSLPSAQKAWTMLGCFCAILLWREY